MTSWIYCEDIKKRYGKYGPQCCHSCHAEMYEDSEELEVVAMEKERAYVCCSIAKIIENDKKIKTKIKK